MNYRINDIEDVPEYLALGKKVYIIYGPNKVKSAKITAYHATVFNDPELGDTSCCPFALSLSAYFISDYFSAINWDVVPFDFIAKDENQAKEWAKFYPVEFSEEDWYKVIGERPNSLDISEENDKNMESLEDCELGICCAIISAIRSTLIKCRDHKGLIGMEIIRLENVMNNGTHDMPENAPILENILKQLKIKWE